MTAPARWFILVDGEQVGPFALTDLRAKVVAGELVASTWVWADGMPEWRQALKVPALVPPRERAIPGWGPTIEV